MVNNCRICGHSLETSFCDLGMSPLSNSFLTKEQLANPEQLFPLHAMVCSSCFLVQVPMFERPENIFTEYAYFSSYSKSWLDHAKKYTDKMIQRFKFGPQHFVVEIASNDGYLLKFFKELGIPILGIEPAENVALVAQSSAGVPTLVKFFGRGLAEELSATTRKADLLIGNNVLAHVPDINDFVSGMKVLLSPTGVITMEFPHLLELMKENQFDTIYHEHFSYLSFFVVQRLFDIHGLRLFDVESMSTHGGSLRIFGCHRDDKTKANTPAVEELLNREHEFGVDKLETYKAFETRVRSIKLKLTNFLQDMKRQERLVAGYGAPAKGNTLLNYCGIKSDLLPFTVDISPYKQNKFLPGVHIPVLHPDEIKKRKPDYLLVLPWNIKDEVMLEHAYIKEWGGKFVLPIPEVKICP